MEALKKKLLGCFVAVQKEFGYRVSVRMCISAGKESISSRSGPTHADHCVAFMKLKLKPASALKRLGSALVTGLAIDASHKRHKFLRVDFLFLRFDHFSPSFYPTCVFRFNSPILFLYFFCLPAVVANVLGPLNCSI